MWEIDSWLLDKWTYGWWIKGAWLKIYQFYGCKWVCATSLFHFLYFFALSWLFCTVCSLYTDSHPLSLTPNPDARPCLTLACECLNYAPIPGLKDEQRCSHAKNTALVSLECCLWHSKWLMNCTQRKAVRTAAAAMQLLLRFSPPPSTRAFMESVPLVSVLLSWWWTVNFLLVICGVWLDCAYKTG